MMDFLISIKPLILGIHIFICIFMIIVILLQAGKGADMGAAFGAGGSQSLFGARGAATFLSKVTTIAALMFLVTSVSLAAIHKNQSQDNINESVIKDKQDKAEEKNPNAETPQPSPEKIQKK